MTPGKYDGLTHLSKWEQSYWAISFRHDEIVEYHRPQPSLVPAGVRELAAAMIRQVRDDLRDFPEWRTKQAADYRPDPDGAKAWLLREDDRPLGYCWCCIVLGLDPSWARAQLLRRATFPRAVPGVVVVPEVAG